MTGKRPSKWLENYDYPKGDLVMQYLEDERDIDLVYGHLKGLLKKVPPVPSMDSVKFTLDVLMPEAIIEALVLNEGLTPGRAEQKFLDGPLYTQSEREEFDLWILETQRDTKKRKK